MSFKTEEFYSNSMLPLEPLKKYLDEHGSLSLSLKLTSEGFPHVEQEVSAENEHILTMMLFVALAESRRLYTLLKGVILSYESTVLANKILRDSIIGSTVVTTRLETEKIFIQNLAMYGEGPLIDALLTLYNTQAAEVKKNIPAEKVKKFVPIEFSAS